MRMKELEGITSLKEGYMVSTFKIKDIKLDKVEVIKFGKV